MKKILFLLLALPFMVQAQSKIVLISSGSYATGDTTDWVSVGARDNLVLAMHFNDSVNVTILVAFKLGGYSTSTYQQTYAIVSDSTNSTNGTGFDVTKVLRSPAADNIPGADRVRVQMLKKSTKNGVTTPTYDAWLWRN